MSETTKKIIAGGAVVAAVALGYLTLRPGETPPEIAPVPSWQENRPQVASVPPMEVQPLILHGPSFGGAMPRMAGAGEMGLQDVALADVGAMELHAAAVGGARQGEPVTMGILVASQWSLASVGFDAASVEAGASEQTQARSGTLQLPSVQVKAPGVPGWLDGWFWPSWRGRSPAPPEGVVPVVVWPGAPPAGQHLVAVVADDAMPMKALAQYLADDTQAMAVILAWEETDHSFRPDATLDAARAEAVAKTVRASRPGLPVWLLCSLTVTGSPEQAAAKVKAAEPDALVLYGLFARAAWESDKVVAANLEKGRKLLAGKPIYAAGQRLTGNDLKTAVDRAKRLGWGGLLCDGSAR